MPEERVGIGSKDPMFDPGSPEFRADPYPTYRRLREADPLHWSSLEGGGFWVVSRHEDIEPLLRDHRVGTAGFTSLQELYLGDDAAYRTLRSWMLFKDGAEHARLRKLVSQAFNPRAVAAMRPQIERIV